MVWNWCRSANNAATALSRAHATSSRYNHMQSRNTAHVFIFHSEPSIISFVQCACHCDGYRNFKKVGGCRKARGEQARWLVAGEASGAKPDNNRAQPSTLKLPRPLQPLASPPRHIPATPRSRWCRWSLSHLLTLCSSHNGFSTCSVSTCDTKRVLACLPREPHLHPATSLGAAYAWQQYP